MNDTFQQSMLEDPARARAGAEVQPGETLVWAAMLDPVCWTRATKGLFGFGILLMVEAVVMCGFIASGKGPSHPSGGMSPLLGPICVCLIMSLVLLSAPLIYRWYTRGTVYALTDRRALIITRTVHSVYKDKMGAITVTPRKNSNADIVFATELRRNRNTTYEANIGFYNIGNPREVEEHLRRIKDAQNS